MVVLPRTGLALLAVKVLRAPGLPLRNYSQEQVHPLVYSFCCRCAGRTVTDKETVHQDVGEQRSDEGACGEICVYLPDRSFPMGPGALSQPPAGQAVAEEHVRLAP